MTRRGDVIEAAAARGPRAKKPVPFAFVLESLEGLEVTTRPMFGCTAVYVGPRIVLVLRRRGDADDGVWVATTAEYHASLRAELPSLRTIAVFGQPESGWQNLPADGPAFEDEVGRVCALVRAGDGRVGKVPKGRGGATKGPKGDDDAVGEELRLPRKQMVHPEAIVSSVTKKKPKGPARRG